VFLPHTQCKPEEKSATNLQTGTNPAQNVEFQKKNAQTQRLNLTRLLNLTSGGQNNKDNTLTTVSLPGT
jgi:hypothetical protein